MKKVWEHEDHLNGWAVSNYVIQMLFNQLSIDNVCRCFMEFGPKFILEGCVMQSFGKILHEQNSKR